MSFDVQTLMASARENESETGFPPVESWHPDFCGEMDMVIRSDGSWWHEGRPFTRPALVKLFASILRKDADGETYLVTPAEKIRIQVERAHFVAIRVDVEGEGQSQRLFFTTNMGEIIQAGPERPLRVKTDLKTLEPSPFISVRGRLEASLTRPVFYELVEQAVEQDTGMGKQLGLYSAGVFFPLGPIGVHEI